MSLSFPTSPTNGQIYQNWKWNSTSGTWEPVGGGGVTSFNTRTGAVTLVTADVTGAGGAPLASPAFTGTPTAPTPTAGDNSTDLATTAFVATALGGAGGGVPSGTRMLFIQAAAPTGWTRVTTWDDSLLRIVGSATPSSGGSYGFVATFNTQTVTQGTSLNTTTMAYHRHTQDAATLSSTGSQKTAGGYSGGPGNNTTFTAYAGSGGAHSHSFYTSIKYVDALIASKN